MVKSSILEKPLLEWLPNDTWRVEKDLAANSSEEWCWGEADKGEIRQSVDGWSRSSSLEFRRCSGRVLTLKQILSVWYKDLKPPQLRYASWSQLHVLVWVPTVWNLMEVFVTRQVKSRKSWMLQNLDLPQDNLKNELNDKRVLFFLTQCTHSQQYKYQTF